MPQSAYIHIPFCNRICPYCDFNKYVVKGQPIEQYLHDLDQDMLRNVQRYPFKNMRTVYVGGGTPSVLDIEQLNLFFSSVHERLLTHSHPEEFTMEINPETLTEEKVKVMKQWGVNRFSIGVQTFEPQLLRKLGRMHSNKDVYNCIEIAKKHGIDNISLDLMFGLPEQTVDMFERTLNEAIALDVTHFSAYSLKVEEGTFFQTLLNKGKLPLPSEDEEVDMYERLMNTMAKHGYEQYEISNFAKPGYESAHNLTYWQNEEYYGFGAGAHGYVKGVRHENAGPLQDYHDLIKQGSLPYIQTIEVDQQARIEEEMMMGLRLRQGVSTSMFKAKYGRSLTDYYQEELEQLIARDLIEEEEDRIKLTKKGIFLGNVVFSTFLKDPVEAD
ncbi:radical SAM family heme chaperone HemW [Caldalkalibacillus salinus]|uniref:radical SAM family heme chaperone HemW n=1 Tax=Caldalkalibacillus salinus TaxID=2803787 RepID=UPI0019238D21|nr:radical SAM family heme chaperone HemW [Caldalkalibacillus salinus]